MQFIYMWANLDDMVSCIIVCGGLSTRMGKDKSFIRFDGKTFIENAIDIAMFFSDDIVLAVSTPQQKGALQEVTDLPVVVDEVQWMGPLAGILTGLRYIRNDYTVVLPVDNPLVKPRLMEHLIGLREGRDAVIPGDRGHLEPMVAVYRKEPMIDACERTLREGEKGIYSAARSLEKVKLVPVESLRVFDPHLLSFKNVNTPEDLEEFKAIFHGIEHGA